MQNSPTLSRSAVASTLLRNSRWTPCVAISMSRESKHPRLDLDLTLRLEVVHLRPSARVPRLDIQEHDQACDLDVLLRSARGELVADLEVTLCRGADSCWRPPTSMPHGSWIHGASAVNSLWRVAVGTGPWAHAALLRLLAAVSGRTWPPGAAYPSVASVASGRVVHAEDVCLDLCVGGVPSGAVIRGDVVRHAASGFLGVVSQIERTDLDGVAHLIVAPERALTSSEAGDDLLDEDGWARWTSAEVSVQSRRDPYRCYLAMCAAEDDLRRRARRRSFLEGLDPDQRRLRRHRRMQREFLGAQAWDRWSWKLMNGKDVGARGGFDFRRLGREHWWDAALDCLERRTRVERLPWPSAPGAPEVSLDSATTPARGVPVVRQSAPRAAGRHTGRPLLPVWLRLLGRRGDDAWSCSMRTTVTCGGPASWTRGSPVPCDCCGCATPRARHGVRDSCDDCAGAGCTRSAHGDRCPLALAGPGVAACLHCARPLHRSVPLTFIDNADPGQGGCHAQRVDGYHMRRRLSEQQSEEGE